MTRSIEAEAMEAMDEQALLARLERMERLLQAVYERLGERAPDETKARWVNTEQFLSSHPSIKPGTLRQWIKDAEFNGFGACVRRSGVRVVIEERAAEAWYDAHLRATSAPSRQGLPAARFAPADPILPQPSSPARKSKDSR